ncbi:XRE family transcriptional regulator [Bacillus sp. JJ1533]|uniref:XRE family transcriptional regulator n=1 Tax=Bacillus sp. JJ1533 TaxID=3122959 RepID=UPI002FFF6B50
MAEKKRETKTMIEAGFISKLGETLKELDDTTRNALAVEAKIRPLTINEIVNGEVKQINLRTLGDIIETLNRIAHEKGIQKKYNVTDIFEYYYKNKEDSQD